MRSFDDLISEALHADTSGWGFDFLDGRASEERPPWGYAKLLAARLATVNSALDLDTGGGEVLNEAAILPPRMAVTESWPPNAAQAKELLRDRGVDVVQSEPGLPLPFPSNSFELVTSRHPVAPYWTEIYRVLEPGGTYFAQHVGPASAFELIEFFLGPQPEARKGRDPLTEMAQATAAGLVIEDLKTARCRMTFNDIGAVVWILRKCIWWVPSFEENFADHLPKLRELDTRLRGGQPFIAHSTRHLVTAKKPA